MKISLMFKIIVLIPRSSKPTTERIGIPDPCMSLQSFPQQHMWSLKVSTCLLVNPVLKVHMGSLVEKSLHPAPGMFSGGSLL